MRCKVTFPKCDLSYRWIIRGQGSSRARGRPGFPCGDAPGAAVPAPGGADKEAAAAAGARLALAQRTQPVNFHWGSSELMSSMRDPGQRRSCQRLGGIPQESWEGMGTLPVRAAPRGRAGPGAAQRPGEAHRG